MPFAKHKRQPAVKPVAKPKADAWHLTHVVDPAWTTKHNPQGVAVLSSEAIINACLVEALVPVLSPPLGNNRYRGHDPVSALAIDLVTLMVDLWRATLPGEGTTQEYRDTLMAKIGFTTDVGWEPDAGLVCNWLMINDEGYTAEIGVVGAGRWVDQMQDVRKAMHAEIDSLVGDAVAGCVEGCDLREAIVREERLSGYDDDDDGALRDLVERTRLLPPRARRSLARSAGLEEDALLSASERARDP